MIDRKTTVRSPFSESPQVCLDLEKMMVDFSNQYLNEPFTHNSTRYLSRSIAPHIRKLSSVFNRADLSDVHLSNSKYWQKTSAPLHRKIAYFLYFMPINMVRVASIWTELSDFGFRWPNSAPTLRAIDLGSGLASGVCAVAASEKSYPIGLPKYGSWAQIDQDKSILDMGQLWSKTIFSHFGFDYWDLKSFHRKLKLQESFLPNSAPRFNLWVMSYFLNELSESPKLTARSLLKTWQRHLSDEGLVIISEPALKDQSRKLLELRSEILKLRNEMDLKDLKVLLPCLGEQRCGAYENPDDWCHEETQWWRPPIYKTLDRMTGLNHKTLPFSYLVLIKSKKKIEELLPKLKGCSSETRYRLVSPPFQPSPSKSVIQFYLCGANGKHKTQLNQKHLASPLAAPLQRSSVLLHAKTEFFNNQLNDNNSNSNDTLKNPPLQKIREFTVMDPGIKPGIDPALESGKSPKMKSKG